MNPDAPAPSDDEREALATIGRLFKEHRPVGAYLPVGQLDGDCYVCHEPWPCPEVMGALHAAGFRRQGAVSVSREQVADAIEAADAEIKSYGASVNEELLYGADSDMPERVTKRVLAALGIEVSG